MKLPHLEMTRPSEPNHQEKIEKYKALFDKITKSVKSDIDSFKISSKDGEFEGENGEEAKLEAQKKILRNLDKIEKMKKNLDSGNIPERDPEKEIDTTATPKIPSWLKSIEENDTSLGTIEWDKEAYKDSLYLSPEQIAKKSIKGEKLLELIKKEKIPVLNANILDYLLEHKDEIPEDWKGKRVYFWGTIFRNSDGDRYARYLCWGGSDWGDGGGWLEGGWDDGEPAVRLAS